MWVQGLRSNEDSHHRMDLDIIKTSDSLPFTIQKKRPSASSGRAWEDED